MISILGSAPPIFPKEQLRQATQGYRTDQNCQTDCAPAICTERNDADTVEESENRHHQKERPCDVACIRPHRTALAMHAAPIMLRAAVETAVRKPPPTSC